jgi:60S ribosomal subunit assembly/export protein LOC1
MAPSRTRTVKNKHAAGKAAGGGKSSKTQQSDSFIKSKKPKARVPTTQAKGRPNVSDPKKKKKRVYTEKELGIPELNMVTPVGVQKPKGKKKGKVFVDDRVGEVVKAEACFVGSFWLLF